MSNNKFSAECPYCDTKVMFMMLDVADKRQKFLIEEVGVLTPDEKLGWDVLAECENCSRGILALIVCSGNPLNTKQFCVIKTFPPRFEIDAPEHLPNNVAHYFQQGMRSLSQKDWDAAGVMFREVLEAALKEKFPGIKGSNLSECIKEAAKGSELTSDMIILAHRIRSLGNSAAHTERLSSQKEIEDMHFLTDLMLRYFFTLPGRLQGTRNEGEASVGD